MITSPESSFGVGDGVGLTGSIRTGPGENIADGHVIDLGVGVGVGF